MISAFVLRLSPKVVLIFNVPEIQQHQDSFQYLTQENNDFYTTVDLSSWFLHQGMRAYNLLVFEYAKVYV